MAADMSSIVQRIAGHTFPNKNGDEQAINRLITWIILDLFGTLINIISD